MAVMKRIATLCVAALVSIAAGTTIVAWAETRTEEWSVKAKGDVLPLPKAWSNGQAKTPDATGKIAQSTIRASQTADRTNPKLALRPVSATADPVLRAISAPLEQSAPDTQKPTQPKAVEPAAAAPEIAQPAVVPETAAPVAAPPVAVTAAAVEVLPPPAPVGARGAGEPSAATMPAAPVLEAAPAVITPAVITPIVAPAPPPVIAATAQPASLDAVNPPNPPALLQPGVIQPSEVTGSAPTTAEPQRTPASAGAPAAGPTSPRSVYVLGPADRIKLIVFQEPELSGEFAVQSTGRVALPLLGEIQAQGLTVRDFEVAITTELRARQFLNDPKVAVEVLSSRPFYILGEVTKPGEYPYQAGLSAVNAVATAGGFTPLADQTSVMIKRAGEADWRNYPLVGETQVGAGDTIRIEKGSFFILGEVNRSGEYPFSPGMSVLRAVATAGGFTPRAERGRVLVTRRGETEQREYQMRPDVPLRPGDTIIIQERWF